MKIYIAKATCSLTVQIVANEIGLTPELIHYDVFDKSTSNGDDFAQINPLGYVPVLRRDDSDELMTEATVISSYLADLHPDSGLLPPHGSPERLKADQLLNFTATELAQKHIPLMRKLMTEEGAAWARNKLVMGYGKLEKILSDGRPYLLGEQFSIVDAYVWGTMWQERSGAQIGHLEKVMAYKARIETRPSVIKALKDEADMVAIHKTKLKTKN
jgi:glutathione S-transferase